MSEKMQAAPGDGSAPSPSINGTPAGMNIPPLNGMSGHVRQKSSWLGSADRQYSFDMTTGSSARIGTLASPSPLPVHHRQYSEGASVEKLPSAVLASGRNASVSSFDTAQTTAATSAMETPGQPMSGGRRRHGHGHSHALSHHHLPAHSGPAPAKPASMMSINGLYSSLTSKVHPNMRFILSLQTSYGLSKTCLPKS